VTNDQNDVDAAVRAWVRAISWLADALPGGYHRAGEHGTYELMTGVPLPGVNGVVATRRSADEAEIAAFADSPRLAVAPWSIQVRGDEVPAEVELTARKHGLDQRSSLPFLLKPLTEADGEVVPGVRRIGGDERDTYLRTLAAGYEAPEELLASFAAEAVVDHPAMSAYLAEEDGVPVATSFGVLVGDLVGVFNIATSPAFRRRGHGRRATQAVLHDAYGSGARTAFLHASSSGLRLYERMGFVARENWTLFLP
jgi:ribosomal protein S18 acetylase RimI-like enzyme